MIKVGPQKGLLLLPSRDNVICQGAMRGEVAIQALVPIRGVTLRETLNSMHQRACTYIVARV